MEQEYEAQTHRAEDRHWWYRGRRRMLTQTIRRLRLPGDAEILDGGCGSGRNMVELSRFGLVTGVDISQENADLAKARNVGRVEVGSLLDLPFSDASFDLATCLDVIEHLDDDVAALAELRRVVKPGGKLLVTVPAYGWLWSHHDALNDHRRRYSARMLRAAAVSANWRIKRISHMNALLLPVAGALRALERLSPRATASSLDLWVPPGGVNWLLQQPMNAEAAVISRGGRIPAGLSLVGLLD